MFGKSHSAVFLLTSSSILIPAQTQPASDPQTFSFAARSMAVLTGRNSRRRSVVRQTGNRRLIWEEIAMSLAPSRTLRLVVSLASVLVMALAVGPLAHAQSLQTGIPPFSTVDGGPDQINLADNSVDWSFPVFSKAGRGIPLSFAFIRDTTGWIQGAIPGGTQWFPVFGDSIPSNASIAYTKVFPTCTDGYGTKHTYEYYTYTSFQDLQGDSHPFSIYISYSTVPQPRGTCPGPQTTGSAGTPSEPADSVSY